MKRVTPRNLDRCHFGLRPGVSLAQRQGGFAVCKFPDEYPVNLFGAKILATLAKQEPLGELIRSIYTQHGAGAKKVRNDVIRFEEGISRRLISVLHYNVPSSCARVGRGYPRPFSLL